MFPSIISTFTQVSATDRLNNPSHSALHNSVSSVLTQVQTVIGQSTSSAVGTLMYDVRSPDSNGGGHVQSANKGGTGQTTYTKGDLLVATSSSVLSKLAVGSDGQGLVVDTLAPSGVKWGNPGISISSTIASSSVWTKPANISATSRVFVQLWGGGGSGGTGINTTEAGGGGGGGYKEGWFRASLLSSSVIVQVGKGGDSVKIGNGAGLPGSITVFDVQSSLLTAYAGGGGSNGVSGSAGGGGGGLLNSGSNGLNAVGGLAGTNQLFSSIFGGNGGSGASSVSAAVYGGGGVGIGGPNPTDGAGTPSYAIYGGGGGGAAGSSVITLGSFSQTGGSGSAGSILYGSNTSVTAGSIPGGGGGGAYGTDQVGSSGQGGSGMAIITTFL